MKRVLILCPRLDITFGKGPVPEQRGPITSVRLHWKNFADLLENEYKSRQGVEVIRIEKPLWQFELKDVTEHNPDLVFVPHHESHSFPVKAYETYYYMQNTIPFLFSVDKAGWAAGASVYPYDSIIPDRVDYTAFNKLRDRALSNQSKFPQPEVKDIELPDDYVFFACQIPTDKVIKYHSKFGVETSLIKVCEATKKLGLPLVVKGHPMNPPVMEPIKTIAKNYHHTKWLMDANIHQIISGARSVAVVNSGVGLESLLHKKPVITFGRAEYDCVTNHAHSAKYDPVEVIASAVFNEEKTVRFFDGWYNWCYDSNDAASFKKLP